MAESCLIASERDGTRIMNFGLKVPEPAGHTIWEKLRAFKSLSYALLARSGLISSLAVNYNAAEGFGTEKRNIYVFYAAGREPIALDLSKYVQRYQPYLILKMAHPLMGSRTSRIDWAGDQMPIFSYYKSNDVKYATPYAPLVNYELKTGECFEFNGPLINCALIRRNDSWEVAFIKYLPHDHVGEDQLEIWQGGYLRCRLQFNGNGEIEEIFSL